MRTKIPPFKKSKRFDVPAIQRTEVWLGQSRHLGKMEVAPIEGGRISITCEKAEGEPKREKVVTFVLGKDASLWLARELISACLSPDNIS